MHFVTGFRGNWRGRIRALAGLVWWGALAAGAAEPPPGDQGTKDLVYLQDLTWRLRQPLAEGRDVSVALQCWWQAVQDRQGGATALRRELYDRAFAALEGPLPELPAAAWPANPHDVQLTTVQDLPIPAEVGRWADLEPQPGVACRIVRWQTGTLTQYGVVLAPRAPGKYPLLLYLHGAAYGVPVYALPWLARLAATGYVVVGPALRGEDLFAETAPLGLKESYRCEGQIENLVGEVDDALAMADGALRLPNVAGEKFAVLGHSFGAGVGLLVAARSPQVACVVSYDAWLVNPFRYYWDRMRGGPNNWLSWEYYVKEQGVPAQLAGLKARSAVHHASRIQAPLLLLIGGAYNGSVFHQSHDDLVAALTAHKKTFRYVIVPGGGHNFVLDYRSDEARFAYGLQEAWLRQYFPPRAPEPAP